MENGHWSPSFMHADERYGGINVVQVLEATFWDTSWAHVSSVMMERFRT